MATSEGINGCIYIGFLSFFSVLPGTGYQDVPRQNMALAYGLSELLRCRKSCEHWPQVVFSKFTPSLLLNTAVNERHPCDLQSKPGLFTTFPGHLPPLLPSNPCPCLTSA